MQTDPSTGTKILLLTNNLLEAADLTELFEQRGVGSVVTLRTADDAEHYLVFDPEPPSLIVYGLDGYSERGRNLLGRFLAIGCPILFIDREGEQADPTAFAVVTRPFSSSHVDAALHRLGFAQQR